MTDPQAVETEMAFTPWERSCRHRDVEAPELRQCRRPVGHANEHASGFGPNHRRWT